MTGMAALLTGVTALLLAAGIILAPRWVRAWRGQDERFRGPWSPEREDELNEDEDDPLDDGRCEECGAVFPADHKPGCPWLDPEPFTGNRPAIACGLPSAGKQFRCTMTAGHGGELHAAENENGTVTWHDDEPLAPVPDRIIKSGVILTEAETEAVRARFRAATTRERCWCDPDLPRYHLPAYAARALEGVTR